MTKEEALAKSVVVWKYLAKSGKPSKADAYKTLGLDEDEAFCPLCQYTIEHHKGRCSHCSLNGYWIKGNYTAACHNFGNDFSDTPFSNWRLARESDSRKYWANEMVKLLKEA